MFPGAITHPRKCANKRIYYFGAGPQLFLVEKIAFLSDWFGKIFIVLQMRTHGSNTQGLSKF
jgi:hypothetical protein